MPFKKNLNAVVSWFLLSEVSALKSYLKSSLYSSWLIFWAGWQHPLSPKAWGWFSYQGPNFMNLRAMSLKYQLPVQIWTMKLNILEGFEPGFKIWAGGGQFKFNIFYHVLYMYIKFFTLDLDCTHPLVHIIFSNALLGSHLSLVYD